MSTACGERLQYLHASRQLLYTLPCDCLFELPGRPNVVWTLKDYTQGDKAKRAEEARTEAGFLFKAFETGQIGPRRLARMADNKRPRTATIHEYLDWTVTAVEAQRDGDYDFSGFRLLLLYARERPLWPAPGQAATPQPRAHPVLGAPLDPLPGLETRGRPLSAATLRTGPGYLEVPFVATHEAKRGRGYGRCIVEAMEELARALAVPTLLLCSTKEAGVQSTWKRLGFEDSDEAQLEAWGVEDGDLVHMQNTVQMHKEVPPPRRWRPLMVRHDAYIGRTYVCMDAGAADVRSNMTCVLANGRTGASSAATSADGEARPSGWTCAATSAGGGGSVSAADDGTVSSCGTMRRAPLGPHKGAAAADGANGRSGDGGGGGVGGGGRGAGKRALESGPGGGGGRTGSEAPEGAPEAGQQAQAERQQQQQRRRQQQQPGDDPHAGTAALGTGGSNATDAAAGGGAAPG